MVSERRALLRNYVKCSSLNDYENIHYLKSVKLSIPFISERGSNI